MTRISRILALVFLALAFAACGHEPAGKRFVFDRSKSYGLLAYDIYFVGEKWPNFLLDLFPYDPATGKIDQKGIVQTGCGFICDPGNEEVRFYLHPIDPGTYVVGYLFFQTDYQKSILCFPEKTLEVDIQPGTIHYIGEMTIDLDYPPGVTMTPLRITQHDADHVRGRLTKYPYVANVDPIYRPDGTMRVKRNTAKPGKIVIDPGKFVSYDPGKVKSDTACVGNFKS